MMRVPHDLEVEASALGSALLDRTTREYALAALTAESFYSQKHRQVWVALAGLAARGTPVDVTTVSVELDRLGTPGLACRRPGPGEEDLSDGPLANPRQ